MRKTFCHRKETDNKTNWQLFMWFEITEGVENLVFYRNNCNKYTNLVSHTSRNVILTVNCVLKYN